MDLEKFFSSLPYQFHRHPLIALALVVVLTIFAIKKTKEAFKILLLLIVLGTAVYFLSLTGGTMSKGLQQKDKMIHQTIDKKP